MATSPPFPYNLTLDDATLNWLRQHLPPIPSTEAQSGDFCTSHFVKTMDSIWGYLLWPVAMALLAIFVLQRVIKDSLLLGYTAVVVSGVDTIRGALWAVLGLLCKERTLESILGADGTVLYHLVAIVSVGWDGVKAIRKHWKKKEAKKKACVERAAVPQVVGETAQRVSDQDQEIVEQPAVTGSEAPSTPVGDAQTETIETNTLRRRLNRSSQSEAQEDPPTEHALTFGVSQENPRSVASAWVKVDDPCPFLAPSNQADARVNNPAAKS